MPTEQWLPVDGHEYYEVSNLGRMRSLDRTVVYSRGGTRVFPGRVLKASPGLSGYPVVGLCASGKIKTMKVHRLVAVAFLPNPDGHPQINHKNGIKTDNAASNLEWCTASHNVLHSFNTGLKSGMKGESNGSSKLTESDILEIRIRLAAGDNAKEIAEDFGVGHIHIGSIKRGMLWSHVESPPEITAAIVDSTRRTLRESDVAEIRKRLANGEHIKSIAKDFGVKERRIRRIKSGEKWSSVPIAKEVR